MAVPEKISLWDRWFNRYRRVIVEEGTEKWRRTEYISGDPRYSVFGRKFVKYKIIDRVTGSERIELEYLT